MGRKNQQQALQSGPPAALLEAQQIGKVETINGNNIYTVLLPDTTDEGSATQTTSKLVELPPKFRNSMWIRRGGFVLVDLGAFEGRENKLAGEIVTVIHDEKSWRKMTYWPKTFSKEAAVTDVPQDSLGHVDDDDEDNDSLSGMGNYNRRRIQDSSDED